MSLSSAMYTGISGILTMGNSMSVIGDNIANVNTVGFKGNRSLFSDILANSLANGDTVLQMGRGVFTQDIQSSWNQGSFETTANATDMAIQGNGFFIVRDTANNADYYTRAGQFNLSSSGLLVNPNNYSVQGYAISTSPTGVQTVAGSTSNIDLSGSQSMPRATTSMRLGLNLDASASAGTTFNTSYDVYNNLGERVTLQYTFTKNSSLNWGYNVTASSGTITTGGTGTLIFNSAGALTSPATNPTVTIANFTTSGAATLTPTWALFDANGAAYSDITNYSAASSTTFINQDGFSAGILEGLSVNADGIISGLFSNGQTEPLYQLALAKFQSNWGLERFGASLFGQTSDSGQAIIGVASVGGLGSVLGSALELSNVDMAQEFVKMIQHQRAYQASSRIITTTDDMLAEAVNLKR